MLNVQRKSWRVYRQGGGCLHEYHISTFTYTSSHSPMLNLAFPHLGPPLGPPDAPRLQATPSCGIPTVRKVWG